MTETTEINWGITTPEQLLGNLRVAETGGDITECADALEWMLRSGRLLDRETMTPIMPIVMDNREPNPKPVGYFIDAAEVDV